MRASLTHPVLLTATALLLLNDHVLKAAYPGFATDKLSDLAGVLAFAWCLAALAPRRQWARALAFAATELGFSWFKSAAAGGVRVLHLRRWPRRHLPPVTWGGTAAGGTEVVARPCR